MAMTCRKFATGSGLPRRNELHYWLCAGIKLGLGIFSVQSEERKNRYIVQQMDCRYFYHEFKGDCRVWFNAFASKFNDLFRKQNVTDQEESEHILWEGYPSWGQFSWLYFLSLWTALRGLVFIRVGVPGWEMWMVGAGFLLGVVVGLRYWAKYLITSRQVIIRNGYSGKTIRCASHDMIHAVEVMQGPLATILGIGTVVIRSHDSNRTLRFRGVKTPEIVGAKLRALLPASSPVFTPAL